MSNNVTWEMLITERKVRKVRAKVMPQGEASGLTSILASTKHFTCERGQQVGTVNAGFLAHILYKFHYSLSAPISCIRVKESHMFQ